MLRGPSSQNHDPAVILSRPLRPPPRARVGRSRPQLPSEPGIEIREACGEAPQLEVGLDELADLSHDRGGVSPAPMLERSRDALDVAGSKGPVCRRQEPFNDCSVRDNAVLHGKDMKPAHRVVPVVVSKSALKGFVQQLSERMQIGFGKLMSCHNPNLDHRNTMCPSLGPDTLLVNTSRPRHQDGREKTRR